MTEEEIQKKIEREVYKTICLFAEYASRMKEEDTLHDVLRKLKWKLKQEKWFMATVQDELDFENLPQEIKDLVKRLFASECTQCTKLADNIERLEEENDELETKLYRAYDKIEALKELI